MILEEIHQLKAKLMNMLVRDVKMKQECLHMSLFLTISPNNPLMIELIFMYLFKTLCKCNIFVRSTLTANFMYCKPWVLVTIYFINKVLFYQYMRNGSRAMV